MAKFTPGPMIAEARGSVGGTVFSRNRYGAYTRNRTKPTVSTTERAMLAKSRMTSATQAWAALTQAQRDAWHEWARGNPIVGSLGFPQVLTGHAAFVGNYVHCVILGQPFLTTPPVVPAPAGLTTCSVVPDKTVGDCEITFTPTPPPAGCVLMVWAAQVASSGVTYVQNLLKYSGDSGGPPASPYDAFALIEARIGALVIGYELHLLVAVAHGPTGLISQPLRCEGTIV